MNTLPIPEANTTGPHASRPSSFRAAWRVTRRWMVPCTALLILLKALAWVDLALGTRGHVAVVANRLFDGLLFPVPLFNALGFVATNGAWFMVFLWGLVWFTLGALIFARTFVEARNPAAPRVCVRIVATYLTLSGVWAGYGWWRDQHNLKHDLGLASLPLFLTIHQTGGETWSDVMRLHDCRIIPRDLPLVLAGREFESTAFVRAGATTATPWLPFHEPFIVEKTWTWRNGKSDCKVSINAETNRVLVTFMAD